MEAAQAEIIKSYGKEFLDLELLSIKVKEHRKPIRPSAKDMSRHTVNIDRDQARLYDLILKKEPGQMSDAKLERTNVKIEANNHGELFTASGEVLLLKVSESILEGHDDDEEEQEGMLA
jgi:DNA topoisomerase-1